MKSLSLVASSALLGLFVVACAADGSESSPASSDVVGSATMGARSMDCTPTDGCAHQEATAFCVGAIHLTNTTLSYERFNSLNDTELADAKSVVKAFSQSAADKSASWTADDAKVAVTFDAEKKAYVGTLVVNDGADAQEYAVTCNDVTDAH